MNELTEAKIVKFDFEVPIKRSASDIWDLMINEIDAWWLADFRALGDGSKMTLNAETGGQLIESAEDGSSLEWYRVQMVMPGKALYLVGYMAPDWGGPTTSMLKLAVEERGNGGALVVSDSLMGNVSSASQNSAQSGWKTLFNDGFRTFVEK